MLQGMIDFYEYIVNYNHFSEINGFDNVNYILDFVNYNHFSEINGFDNVNYILDLC